MGFDHRAGSAWVMVVGGGENQIIVAARIGVIRPRITGWDRIPLGIVAL